MNGKTSLYRHYDKSGNLLYVGISLSAVARLSQHEKHAKWHDDICRVEVKHFDTRQDALNAETKAIQSEKPVHNIQKRFKDKRETKFERAERDRDRLLNDICVLNPFYTVAQVSQMMFCTPQKVRAMIECGDLSAIVTKKYTVKSANGDNVERRQYLVTGWSLIDLMESAHSKETQ